MPSFELIPVLSDLIVRRLFIKIFFLWVIARDGTNESVKVELYSPSLARRQTVRVITVLQFSPITVITLRFYNRRPCSDSLYETYVIHICNTHIYICVNEFQKM